MRNEIPYLFRNTTNRPLVISELCPQYDLVPLAPFLIGALIFVINIFALLYHPYATVVIYVAAQLIITIVDR